MRYIYQSTKLTIFYNNQVAGTVKPNAADVRETFTKDNFKPVLKYIKCTVIGHTKYPEQNKTIQGEYKHDEDRPGLKLKKSLFCCMYSYL